MSFNLLSLQSNNNNIVNKMSSKISINTNAENSFDLSKNGQKNNKISEQLNSTALVFCEAVNQMVKAHLVNYNETNNFQTINFSFAQKVIRKTRISFSQLVVSLVYLNRYYESIIKNKKHIPGHEGSIIPSLSHVVLLCIIQAERYITDIPHRLSWWASICAGQTKSIDINKWQRDFFDTINYKLYVHPEKDFNIFKFQIKRLAVRLFNNSAKMPQQLRRSINLGSQQQPTPTTASSTNSNRIPSQPNIISTSNSISTSTVTQPKILLSPLYSGNSNVINPTAILSCQSNSLVNINVQDMNITNTTLTTSPSELSVEGTMVNQINSPNSICTNSQHSFQLDTRNKLQSTSPLPPTQNPNNLMVISNVSRSPIKKSGTNTTTSGDIEKENNTTTSVPTTQSPSQFCITLNNSPMINSPLDDTAKSSTQIHKRKRSYYDAFQISSITARVLKAAQGIKRSRMPVTISPEEIEYQPCTPNSRPIEENNTKENDNNKYLFQNQNISLNKEKNGTSSLPIQLAKETISSDVVKNSFLNSLENIRSTTNQSDINSSSVNKNSTSVNSEEIIVSSLLLASNNTPSINLIPVSPPLTPK